MIRIRSVNRKNAKRTIRIRNLAEQSAVVALPVQFRLRPAMFPANSIYHAMKDELAKRLVQSLKDAGINFVTYLPETRLSQIVPLIRDDPAWN